MSFMYAWPADRVFRLSRNASSRGCWEAARLPSKAVARLHFAAGSVLQPGYHSSTAASYIPAHLPLCSQRAAITARARARILAVLNACVDLSQGNCSGAERCFLLDSALGCCCRAQQQRYAARHLTVLCTVPFLLLLGGPPFSVLPDSIDLLQLSSHLFRSLAHVLAVAFRSLPCSQAGRRHQFTPLEHCNLAYCMHGGMRLASALLGPTASAAQISLGC